MLKSKVITLLRDKISSKEAVLLDEFAQAVHDRISQDYRVFTDKEIETAWENWKKERKTFSGCIT